MSLPPPLGVPDVDYLATSVRPAFGSLPSAVRDAVGDAAGSPVVAADPPVASGFGGAFAGLLTLGDGGRVFAKAAGPSMPHIVEALRREAEVLPRVVSLRCATRLVGAGRVPVEGDGEDESVWRVLVLEAVDGVQPGRPWTEAEADAAHDACVEIAGADVGDLRLDRLDEELAGSPGPFATLAALADGSRSWPAGHVRVDGHDADLVSLAGGMVGAVRGDAVVHRDLRPDNLLREPSGTMRALDWNQVCRGARWVDLVLLWPLMRHHGIDVRRFDGSPLLAGVTDDEVDAFLAWLVGFMLTNVDAPPPPGCTPALRAHAVFTSDLTLRLLAERRGWALTS